MKKFSFKVAMVAVVAAVAGIGVYTSQKADAMSDIALANVEALAQSGETPDGRKLYEHHCGSDPGTQCKPWGVTGNTCPYERSCP